MYRFKIRWRKRFSCLRFQFSHLVMPEMCIRDRGKQTTPHFKLKEREDKPSSEWIRVEGTLSVSYTHLAHIGSHAPYGYMKNPDNKKEWLIDEEAAAVVREIFRLCVNGYGPTRIANIRCV